MSPFKLNVVPSSGFIGTVSVIEGLLIGFFATVSVIEEFGVDFDDLIPTNFVKFLKLGILLARMFAILSRVFALVCSTFAAILHRQKSL